jgi:hypothetical protein
MHIIPILKLRAWFCAVGEATSLNDRGIGVGTNVGSEIFTFPPRRARLGAHPTSCP